MDMVALETPVDVAALALEALQDGPPVQNIPGPPEAGNDIDSWGNIRREPVRVLQENHNKNCITIFLYEYSGAFYFGYQIKVERLIRQKKANVKDQAHDTPEEARLAAREAIKKIYIKAGRSTRELMADFDKIMYNQPELF